MTKMPPHPLSVVFLALAQHAGYDPKSTGNKSNTVCDKPCCRFVQLMGEEEPPLPADVRPGRGAKRSRGPRHYTKRIA
jgi:hypothetical protein